jgi:6-phosphogluconolactonase
MSNTLSLTLLLIFNLIATSLIANGTNNGPKEIMYVGTFSERGSMGIYVYEVFRDNMRFDLLQTIVSKGSPSFIAISPKEKYMFSANREGINDVDDFGSITSFSIDPATGKLTKIQDYSSFGVSPCHISIHPTGKYLFVCHYVGGNVVVLPVDESGKIGEPTQNIQYEGKGTIMPQQSGPHPHSAVPNQDGKYVYISDLGQDKIQIYRFDEVSGKLIPADTPFIRTMPGAGPRHFTLHPKGSIAFSSEEISSSICSYSIDPNDGSLRLIQRLPALPEAFFGQNSSADVHTTSDGKFVYISNRGYNGLAIYKVNAKGKMKNIGYMPTIGRRPRGFLPDPLGEFMLVGNRDSDEINIFMIEKDGKLKDTSAYLPVPSNSCIQYLFLK